MKKTLVALAIALLFDSGCDSADLGCNSSPVRCSIDTDCIQGNVPGTCKPSSVEGSTEHWCAFPDPTCGGGLRWGILSGEGLASSCLAGGEPDAGPLVPLSKRIFVGEDGSSLFVYDAASLEPIGTITLPPADGYNLGMSVTAESVFVTRGGADYSVVGVDPLASIVRPGFPKTVTACTPRFVFDAGLYCLSGTNLQLYAPPNFTTLLRTYPSPAMALPTPFSLSDGLLLVVVDKTMHVLDTQLSEIGIGIPQEKAIYASTVSQALNRLAIADATTVRLYNLTTRAQIGASRTFISGSVTGAVFDATKLIVTLSSGEVVAISADDAATDIIPPVHRGASMGFTVYDSTRNRVVALDDVNLVVLDAATLQHVAGSPTTLPRPGLSLLVF